MFIYKKYGEKKCVERAMEHVVKEKGTFSFEYLSVAEKQFAHSCCLVQLARVMAHGVRKGDRQEEAKVAVSLYMCKLVSAASRESN